MSEFERFQRFDRYYVDILITYTSNTPYVPTSFRSVAYDHTNFLWLADLYCITVPYLSASYRVSGSTGNLPPEFAGDVWKPEGKFAGQQRIPLMPA